jgi:SPFH domain/Band 7 family protein
MEAIINFLLTIWQELVPFVKVAPDEGAVRVTTIPMAWLLRVFPSLRRWLPANTQWVHDLRPGAAWKLPLLSDIRKVKVTPTYADIPNIRVQTTDGKVKLISLTAKFHVHNVRRALLEVDDFAASVVVDVQSLVTAWGNKLRAEEITVERLVAECTAPCRTATLEWGCRLRELGTNSIADHKVYSLINGE